MYKRLGGGGIVWMRLLGVYVVETWTQNPTHFVQWFCCLHWTCVWNGKNHRNDLIILGTYDILCPFPFGYFTHRKYHENIHSLQPQLLVGAEPHSKITGCYWITRTRLERLSISSEAVQTWRSQARPESVRRTRPFPCSRIISNRSQRGRDISEPATSKRPDQFAEALRRETNQYVPSPTDW